MWLNRYPFLRNLVYIGIPILFFFLIAAPWVYQLERLFFFACLILMVKLDNSPWFKIQKSFKTFITLFALCWTLSFLYFRFFDTIHDRGFVNGSFYYAIEGFGLLGNEQPVDLFKFNLAGSHKITTLNYDNDGCSGRPNMEIIEHHGSVMLKGKTCN